MISFIIPSKYTKEEFVNNAQIYKYTNRGGHSNEAYRAVNENSESLSVVYNRELKQILDSEQQKVDNGISNYNLDNSIVVFCHDDLSIEDIFLEQKLKEGLSKFDVVGLAGTRKFDLKFPPVWNNTVPENYSGAVAHLVSGNLWVTAFGPFGQVLLLDGIFLATKVSTLKKLETLRFDESCPSKFNFYDLDFCLTAHKLGLKLGTVPIWTTHYSPGDWTRSEDWNNGQNWFIKKWDKIF